MNQNLLRFARYALVIATVAIATGCATVPPGAGKDPRDPLEAANRQIFAFNDGFDKYLLKPVAQAYDAVLPVPVQDCISGIFGNLREPSHAVNNLLQWKLTDAGSDVCRFAVNTTAGVLGCFDVASRLGLEKHQEDFGQTLAVWGVGSGPYIVIPFLGPSTVRDGVGLYVETYLDPNFYVKNIPIRNSILVTRIVAQRASLLQNDKLIDGAALDKYLFVRDGYLQFRRNLVYDGNPPPPVDDSGADDTPANAATPPSAAAPTMEPKKSAP